MITSLRDWLLAIGVVLLAVVAGCLLIIATAEGQSPPTRYHFTEYAEQLIYLDREAINAAYVEHVKKLYVNWVVDYSEAPPRALKSMENARNAYARAMREIDKREREFEATKPK